MDRSHQFGSTCDFVCFKFKPVPFITDRNEVLAKVIFLHLSVIHSDQAPPRTDTPPGEQTPPTPRLDPLDQAGTPRDQTRHRPWTRQVPSPGPDTPWTRHPPGADTPRTRQVPPPGIRHPPPPREAADSGTRSMLGRYESYWNAFLFCQRFTFHHTTS